MFNSKIGVLLTVWLSAQLSYVVLGDLILTARLDFEQMLLLISVVYGVFLFLSLTCLADIKTACCRQSFAYVFGVSSKYRSRRVPSICTDTSLRSYQPPILYSKRSQSMSDPSQSKSDSIQYRSYSSQEHSTKSQANPLSTSTPVAEPQTIIDDLRTACQNILGQPQLKKLLPFDIAEIYLLDEKTQTFSLLLRLSEEGYSRLDCVYGFGETVTGWIAEEQTSLHIGDTQQADNSRPPIDHRSSPFRAFLGVPLKADSKLLGTVELAASEPHTFSQSDTTVLEIVAGQVAIALQNTRLFAVTNQQLQVRVDELAGLQRVSSELNSTLDLNKILGTVLEEALRVTQADFGNVYFYNASTAELMPYRKQDNVDTNSVNGLFGRAISAQRGIVGRAIRSGTSILVSDVTRDSDYMQLGRTVRSKVVVPIRYGGESVGIINLESSQLNFFSDNQLRYLEALANHAAVAIGNAGAYQEQRLEREQASRRADQLSRLAEISTSFRTNRPLTDVLEDIAFAIADSVGYDVVLISLVRNEPPKLHHEVAMGLPVARLHHYQQPDQARPLTNLQKLLQDKFQWGKNAYFIPKADKDLWQGQLNLPFVEKRKSPSHSDSRLDTPHLMMPATRRELWETGDLLLIPLRGVSDNVVGLLTVQNPVDGNRPTLAAINALETFANHAASAIENAQLFELEQERRRLADTLRGVSEVVSSHLDIDQLLQLVLQELRKVVDYDRSTVELLQESHLVIIGGQGWEEYSRQIVGLSFSMTGNNPNRKVLETQEPVIVKDAQSEYEDIFKAPPYDKVQSWLGVPLTYGTNIMGLMSVASHHLDFFSEEDAGVVLAFANQVAIALQNAQLFEEAKQQVRQLEALTEVAGSLNQALELDQVLNLVLDAVFDLVGHSNGSIWMIEPSTGTVKIANTQNIPDFLVEEFNLSNTSVNSEPFASVIRSGEILVVGKDKHRDKIAPRFGLPFPDNVTYVPLKTEDGVIGILAIETIIRSRSMLDLVSTLADLAAVAIDSARLLADTRTRAAEMQNLYSLGVDISGMLDARQVMRSVAVKALTLLKREVGVILFWDEQIEQYIFEGTAVTSDLVEKFGLDKVELVQLKSSDTTHPLALWTALTEQVISSSEPVLSNTAIQKSIWAAHENVSSDPPSPLPTDQMVMQLGLRTLLGVPIQVRNQMSGAILVGSLQPNGFSRREVQTLSFVANQASVAIRNAQLVQRLNLLTEGLEQRVIQRTEELAQTLQELTDERDRMGVLYELGRQLTSSFNLEEVLHHALNLLNGAIGISQGTVLLQDFKSGFLVHRAAIGRDKALPPEGSQTNYQIGMGLAGKVMENRQPRLIPDLTIEPDWIPGSSVMHRRSALAVPLTTGDDVLGALLLFHPEVGYFTEDHLKLVTTAAIQIATAINNAELYRLSTDQAKSLVVMYQQQAAEATKNEAILKSVADGVLVLDTQRQIILANPKAVEILNIDTNLLEYQPLSQILEVSDSTENAELVHLLYHELDRSLARIEEGESTVEFRISAGQKVIKATLTPVALNRNEPPSTVAVLRDISRDAEIDRLKNEFISSVSHELRTPMTSIKGYADLLLSGNPKIGQLNPRQTRFVQVIQSNTNRLTELVNDILEISRIETGRIRLAFEAVDLSEIIGEVATSFEGQMVQKVMNLVLDLPDTLPPVYADKARLTQILVNLIGNAWQYTPESGNINVQARVVDQHVQIDVADDGIGIVEQDKQYLFERFFRSERTEVQVVDGTGLGLSITKSFVEMLGGQIWVESEVDSGSTFSFTVPIAIEEQQSDPKA